MLGSRAPLRRHFWDWLGRLKSFPERSPRGGPLRRPKNARIPRLSSTSLLGLTRPPQIPPREAPGARFGAKKCWDPALLFNASLGSGSAVSDPFPREALRGLLRRTMLGFGSLPRCPLGTGSGVSGHPLGEAKDPRGLFDVQTGWISSSVAFLSPARLSRIHSREKSAHWGPL